MKLFLLLKLAMILVLVSCAQEKEEETTTDTRTTEVSLECGSQHTGICDSNSASAQGKTAYIYYLNNNCLTIDPENQGVEIADIFAYAKANMDCDSTGCIASTTIWYDANDALIKNPPQSDSLGTRAFVSYIDLNSNAQDMNGLDGVDLGTDIISNCSDLEGFETYGTTDIVF